MNDEMKKHLEAAKASLREAQLLSDFALPEVYGQLDDMMFEIDEILESA